VYSESLDTYWVVSVWKDLCVKGVADPGAVRVVMMANRKSIVEESWGGLGSRGKTARDNKPAQDRTKPGEYNSRA